MSYEEEDTCKAGLAALPSSVLTMKKTNKQKVCEQNTNSIATHVAFWTAAAQSNAFIRVVAIEYLLDYGHLLTDVKVSVNNGRGLLARD